MGRSGATEQKIRVDAYSGYRGEETPREFILHGKKVEVVEILSAWIEEGAEYKAIKTLTLHKKEHDWSSPTLPSPLGGGGQG